MSYQVTNQLSVAEYQTLRRSAGWHIFSDEQAKAGLEHSAGVICIRDADRAVAMARYLWDQGNLIYIADVIVLPEYQGQGLGKMAVEAVMDHIRQHVPKGYFLFISLLAAKGKEGFYEKLGFKTRPCETDGAGMHIRGVVGEDI